MSVTSQCIQHFKADETIYIHNLCLFQEIHHMGKAWALESDLGLNLSPATYSLSLSFLINARKAIKVPVHGKVIIKCQRKGKQWSL